MSRRGLHFWFWFFSCGALMLPWCAGAQVRRPPQPVVELDADGNALSVEAALHQMSTQSKVIFIGTVASIRRNEGSSVGSGVVEIGFNVEQAIRGCSGNSYSLREWAGLWNANESRYKIGQRLLLMLHAPGVTGLSSPIGGLDGAIPLRASGAGVLYSDASTGAPEIVADLRWIGARVVRTRSYSLTPSQTIAIPSQTTAIANPRVVVGARSRIGPGLATSMAPEIVSAARSDASTPAQEAAVSTLVAMFRTWERDDAPR